MTPVESGSTLDQRIRTGIFLLMCVGMGGWFAYDGWVGYPAKNLAWWADHKLPRRPENLSTNRLATKANLGRIGIEATPEQIRQLLGEPTLEIPRTLTYAGNLFACITGREPSDVEERSLEAALILSADHGFTSPTFAARVVASAGGDLYSAVTSAMGTLIGTRPSVRHVDVLRVLQQVRSAESAAAWVRQRVLRSLPIPGFRPTAYPVIDPRAALLERQCSELAESCGRLDQEEIADAIEQAVWEELQRPPALEWPAARLYSYLGLEADLHLPVFVCGRLVGWCAHFLEEAENEQRIRPRARYRGARDCEFEPLFLRG